MSQFETPPSQAAASESLFPGFPTLDVTKLTRLFIKRIWIAAAIAGIFVILALVKVLTATKMYESTALINIEASSGGGKMADGLMGIKQKSWESLDELKSVASGMTGGSVVLRVIDELNLRNDVSFHKNKKTTPTDSELLKFMSKRLSSELIRGERNIALSVEDTDPKRAKLIAEKLISEFQELLSESSLAVADKTQETLQRESVAQGARVADAEKQLQQFREQYPNITFDEEGGVSKAKFTDLQEISNRANDEYFKLKAEYEQYLKVKSQPERILEIGTYAGIESIQKLLLSRDQKVAEFHKIKAQFTQYHPTYKAHKGDVDGLNEQVRQSALALGESIEKRYNIARQRTESATGAVKTQAAFILQAEGIRQKFRELNRSREAALATYDRVLERINDAKVARNVDETVIHTFSPPLVNPKPIKPNKPVTVALAGFLGSFIGVGVVLILSLLDRTLTSKRQVESTLGLTVLAQVPESHKDQEWNLKETIMASRGQQSLVSEGFRSLRTSLSSMTPRSVMFTSATSCEGKSFCAANLATLQAQMGYRTLLVDADFRKPQMADIFVAPHTPDESNSQLATQNHCQETTVPNLYLISLGRFTDTGEPINGEHFAAMLWEAYSSFDCVIIDSSPLTLVSDSLNYSQYADAVVLVVRENETEAGPAQEAVRELRRMRAPIAGCVLNGVSNLDSARKAYLDEAQSHDSTAF